MAFAFQGVDLKPLILDRLDRLARQPQDAAALMDLSLALQFHGRRTEALAYQRSALTLSRVYRVLAHRPDALRLLIFVAAGDLTVNTPIELILRDRNVTLIKVFVLPGETLPSGIPHHDVAFTAISEFDETRDLLDRLGDKLADWPRPLLNQPRPILELARDRLFRLLEGAPGLRTPPTARVGRDDLASVAEGRADLADYLPSAAFPVIVRPVGSHGGKGLVRIDEPSALGACLESESGPSFYVAPFVDYRSEDGLYRKYRIAFIQGRPFLCHVAISADWMVHYMNSGMDQDPAKRAEEGRAIDEFESGFMIRHDQALRSLAARIGLDYFVIDCGETGDGALLIFEADNAAAIHDLDPPELFPYRRPQMRRVFDDFEAMLRTKALEGAR